MSVPGFNGSQSLHSFTATGEIRTLEATAAGRVAKADGITFAQVLSS